LDGKKKADLKIKFKKRLAKAWTVIAFAKNVVIKLRIQEAFRAQI
jgi:hypothetical protein